MKTIPTILGSMILCAWSGLVGWAAPPYVYYQGLLKDANGDPLSRGSYTIEFNIYNQAESGTKVWGPFICDGGVPATGHDLLVPVVNGRFNVIIGPEDTDGDPISGVFGEANRFMEIKVGANPPIVPRQKFLSTAYAFQAINAQSAQQASSLIQELADALCPPGSILAFGGSTNNIPSGWLLCDGQPYDRNAYPRLYAAIGTAWGKATAAADDPTFRVPDTRGMFLRGVNKESTHPLFSDPDVADRGRAYDGQNVQDAVGSVQGDEFGRHNHDNYNEGDGHTYNQLLRNHIYNMNTAKDVDTTPDQPDITVSEPLVPKGGSETRPKNVYVNYIIKH